MARRPSLAHVFRIFLIFFGLWIAVVGAVWIWAGYDSTLSRIALFFSKAAFVTFGGAYAVLSYITDVAVSSGWLSAKQMLIGLGLAESTPGPLIMVTQFVGFVGGWTLPEGLAPLTAGIIGALITTYVTFLPSFFFIFAGAPFIEAMAGNQRLQAALTGVTAAVVGVVLNLAVWFSLHTLFDSVAALEVLGLIVELPDPLTVDLGACLVAALAALLTFYLKKGMAMTLLISCAVGALLYIVR